MQVNEQEVLSLPATARLQIVDQIMQSLDKPDPEIDRIWGEVAVRRLASFDAGRSKTYSPEEVFGQDVMHVRFAELAKLEFDEARAWYWAMRPELGRSFSQEVRTAAQRITPMPPAVPDWFSGRAFS